MYSGPNLDKWEVKIISPAKKMDFVVTMLKQVVLGLQKIHGLGFTHGDLKTANVCARESSNGSYKFTLIDLGMSSKIARLGDSHATKELRGNLMFASIDHITRKRASQLDDLYSLLCVAYYFAIGSLPWIDCIEGLHKKQKRAYNCIQVNYY